MSEPRYRGSVIAIRVLWLFCTIATIGFSRNILRFGAVWRFQVAALGVIAVTMTGILLLQRRIRQGGGTQPELPDIPVPGVPRKTVTLDWETPAAPTSPAPPAIPAGAVPPRPKRINPAVIVFAAVLVVAAGIGIGVAVTAGGSKPSASSFPVLPNISPGLTEQQQSPTPVQQPSTPAPSTTGPDWNSFGSAVTDRTPFTAAALLPQQFTTTYNVTYRLAAAGPQDCSPADQSADIRNVLTSAGCSQAMTGSYLENGDGRGTLDQTMVSVQIYAFPDTPTELNVQRALLDTSRNFGLWCPADGPGSLPCTSGTDYTDSSWSEQTLGNHRYLVQATALTSTMYTNPNVVPWLDAAAHQAVSSCGPQVWSSP